MAKKNNTKPIEEEESYSIPISMGSSTNFGMTNERTFRGDIEMTPRQKAMLEKKLAKKNKPE